MGLLSFLKREPAESGATSAADAASPDAIRTRARRRLIGAAVLVVGAVLVLPAVFDTKPRPLPVDIPIDIPKRDAAPALSVPPPRVAAVQPPASSAATPASTAEVAETPVKAPVKEAVKEPPKEAPKAVPKESPKPAVKTEPKTETKVAEAKAKPEAKPAPRDKPVTREDAARVQAMLDGRDAKPAKPAEAATRFVVQVGAFEHAAAAKDARQRVEKLGLRSFQQDVDTSQGKRIRVRLGPYSSREEADKAVAKLSAGGIKASVVPL